MQPSSDLFYSGRVSVSSSSLPGRLSARVSVDVITIAVLVWYLSGLADFNPNYRTRCAVCLDVNRQPSFNVVLTVNCSD